MYLVTYADNQKHILRKSGFSTEQEAAEWIAENANMITPFKIINDCGDGCPETVKDFRNYRPGKFKAEYLFKTVAI